MTAGASCTNDTKLQPSSQARSRPERVENREMEYGAKINNAASRYSRARDSAPGACRFPFLEI